MHVQKTILTTKVEVETTWLPLVNW